MLDYLTNYGQQTISLVSLALSIVIALLISLLIVWVYKQTHKSMAYDKSFLVTVLLMGPIISLIITVIGNNIALSIGLVGSLSIIRFRTVIKDSRDLIFLLWAIGVGLGAGTEAWLPTLVASIIIGIVCLMADKLSYAIKTGKDNFVLVLVGSDRKIEKHAIELIENEGFAYSLRSMDMSAEGWQIVFEIRLLKENEFDRQVLMEKLEGIPNIERVSLLAPNLSLPV
jgi:hypothetical protein